MNIDHRQLGMNKQIVPYSKPFVIDAWCDFYDQDGDKVYGRVIRVTKTHVTFKTEKGTKHRLQIIKV